MTLANHCVGNCPACGCPESRPASPVGTRRGKRVQRRRCDHCRKTFRATLDEEPTLQSAQIPTQSRPAVVQHRPAPPVSPRGGLAERPRCPLCSGEARVTSTRKTIRHWKCKACDHNFQLPR